MEYTINTGANMVMEYTMSVAVNQIGIVGSPFLVTVLREASTEAEPSECLFFDMENALAGGLSLGIAINDRLGFQSTTVPYNLTPTREQRTTL